MERRISIVVAVSLNNAIGYRGRLPWNNLSADMKRFKDLTMGHAVIMGRKTWESLPSRFRPLPGRKNIILSRSYQHSEGYIIAHSLEDALDCVDPEEDLFVIGGKEIYQLTLPHASRIYMTIVHGIFNADTHFSDFLLFEWERKEFQSFPADEKNLHPYSFAVFDRVYFRGG